MSSVRTPHPMAMLARQAGWGRSPLRRWSDRVEGAARIVALALAAVAVGLALFVGGVTYRHEVAVAAALRDHSTTATLLQAAPVPVSANSWPATVLVRAQWTDGNGLRHSGPVSSPEGSAAGSRVPIWIDDAGDQVTAPLSRESAAMRGTAAGMAAILGASGVLGALLGAVRWWCDRGRMKVWEQEWQRMSEAKRNAEGNSQR